MERERTYIHKYLINCQHHTRQTGTPWEYAHTLKDVLNSATDGQLLSILRLG